MAASNYCSGTFLIVTFTGIVLGISSCSNASKTKPGSSQTPKAVSLLKSTTGYNVRGEVLFEEVGTGVHILAHLSGLTPSAHGFHIHAKGDCTSHDGKSAGGHFNPHNDFHGNPESEERHVGDLGNVIADVDGNARYDRVDTVISFHGVNGIIGKGIIIHAGRDDLTSQPTGAAGARVACGVIEKVSH